MAVPQRFSLNALPGQIAQLDQRIQRIESALDQILQRLSMPKLEALSLPKEPEKVVEMPKTGPYIYKPLDASKNEIRILMLHSSIKDDNEPVRATLQHVAMEDDVNPGAIARMAPALRLFKALSYTWGDASKKVNITLDGHQCPVTENLFAALKNVRNSNKAAIAANAHTGKGVVSCWWIDAICINQDDVLERNSQVAMMTMIYKRSHGVHVWLGDADEDSDMAMDLIEKIAKYRPVGPGDKEIVYPDCNMEEKVKHWKALTRLFQRPWWNRVWIRQEVAVPRFATVQCGAKTGQLEQICNVAGILNTLNEQLGYQPTQLQLEGYNVDRSASTSGRLRISCYLRATMLQELRHDLGRGMTVKYGDLTDLLFHTRSCQSTDPRDKVFSVLGLVDPTMYGVKPDYRITLDQALKTVARAVITKKQSLDILSGSQNAEGENGLPTWVPNLTEEWRARPLKTKVLYSPGVPDEPDFTFEAENDSVLRANGRTVSFIAAVCDDVVTANATTDQLDTLYRNWKAFIFAMVNHIQLDWDGKRDFRDLTEKQPDRKWLEFLSLGAENGHWLRFAEDGSGRLLPEKGAAAENAFMNQKMVNSLLLPKADDEEAIKVNPYKKYHQNLRKHGIGRRLSYTFDGSVGLVPNDARVGDQVCVFSNTYYPFVLRKVENDKHVVIGEACKYSAFILFRQKCPISGRTFRCRESWDQSRTLIKKIRVEETG
ncbi:uncharacterized protein PAC_14056 [Phialocephala subalpina]|uniref:Heterokaryon incompatibility domain-containing protein n=1 Tax=Phialocephala subalpina TaxID=576137 RepID=A0A1L7XGI1_9HELO|nr:uncharacterized protein PAC_14056 [Phialocephala subalpina]